MLSYAQCKCTLHNLPQFIAAGSFTYLTKSHQLVQFHNFWFNSFGMHIFFAKESDFILLKFQYIYSPFFTAGSKWPVNELTYRISKYSSGYIDDTRVRDEIARAFKVSIFGHHTLFITIL